MVLSRAAPSIGIALIALGFVALLGVAGLQPLGSVVDPPRPFDPLSETEQEQALRIARVDPRVTLLLTDHHVVIGAALHTEKVPEIAKMPRLADVWFYDYTTDLVVWPVVDLGLGVVTHLEVPPPGYQPPLTGTEYERATHLARDHPGVVERLGDGEVVPAARLWGGPETLCPVHRCVTVQFFVDDVWKPDFAVVVDLSLDTVLAVLGPDGTAEEAHVPESQGAPDDDPAAEPEEGGA